MTELKTTGSFAYIDIMKGRKSVNKLVSSGNKIPVTIKGVITDAFSGDDGTSIMFTVEMSSFKLGKPKKVK